MPSSLPIHQSIHVDPLLSSNMATSDPLTSRIARAIARADKKSPLHHQPWQRRQLLSQSGGLCGYCNALLDLENPHSAVINHVVPLQLGGPTLNENRLICCKKCSGSKGNRDLVSWSLFKAKASPTRQAELLCLRAAVDCPRFRGHHLKLFPSAVRTAQG